MTAVAPEPTVAGVRSVLRGAERVLLQVGWTQGCSERLTGHVDAHRALQIAADGDREALQTAHFAVIRALPPHQLLSAWQDHPARELDEVLELLRQAEAHVRPAHQLPREGEARGGSDRAAGAKGPGGAVHQTGRAS